MRKFCVIGDPVAHSKSPLIHTTMLRALGLDDTYCGLRVPAGDLECWLAEAKRADGYAGFNATMPHKQALAALADELDEDAEACGAVNTVCIRNGKLYGYNTDGRGFLQAAADAGIAVSGRKITLLGAGGAAKAVATKLAGSGVRGITVCNRTPEKAAALCAAAPEMMRPAGFDRDTLRRCVGESDVLIHCTSLGMSGTEGQFADFDFLDALEPGAAVCDLIYSPAETQLLAEARRRGCKTMNGLGMLMHQAIFALEHFTGTEIDGAAMCARLKAVLLPPTDAPAPPQAGR